MCSYDVIALCCKGLVNIAIDILLQMSMESSLLPQFLHTCSNEVWFRAVTVLFRSPSTDEKQVEKLSIILQKLSKIRYITLEPQITDLFYISN